jgi:hypothetical protein
LQEQSGKKKRRPAPFEMTDWAAGRKGSASAFEMTVGAGGQKNVGLLVRNDELAVMREERVGPFGAQGKRGKQGAGHGREERFLSSQADHFARAKWKEKASACSVRNDGGGVGRAFGHMAEHRL